MNAFNNDDDDDDLSSLTSWVEETRKRQLRMPIEG
jgi:hypothetical protein